MRNSVLFFVSFFVITACYSNQTRAQEKKEAFENFWLAESISERLEASLAIEKLSLEFDSLYSILSEGRPYSANVPRGKIIRSHKIDGVDHPYLIQIPKNYDPSHEWLLQWDLHGGMGQPKWTKLDGAWNGWGRIDDYNDNHIIVAPAGWWGSMWWEGSQVKNFQKILDEVKRTWNINENRVLFMGNSDGAVASWFYGFRYPDPWALYVGHVGFPARLTNTSMRADGQMHLSNLEGQRYIVNNGVLDKIINIDVTRKYMEIFNQIDFDLDYKEHPNAGHFLNISREDALKPFRILRDFRRDPLPDTLSWSTERTDRYNRRFWVIIDELKTNHPIDESNILPRIVGENVPDTPPFESKPWGRVKLIRDGNTISVNTVGVKKIRLLLSPQDLEFSKPIKLILNGDTFLDAKIEKNISTLLKWHSIDNDRKVLFAAEIELIIPD